MAFIDDLADLLTETVDVVPGYFDGYGDWVSSGAVLAGLPCRIEGGPTIVRDQTGREVVSLVQIYIGSFNNLTVNTHTFTLPSRFSPRDNLRAIRIDQEFDDVGASYETVYLP